MLNGEQAMRFWNRCLYASVLLKLSPSQALLLNVMALGLAHSKDITSCYDLTEFNFDPFAAVNKTFRERIGDMQFTLESLVEKGILIQDGSNYSFSYEFTKPLRESFKPEGGNILYLEDRRRKKTWK